MLGARREIADVQFAGAAHHLVDVEGVTDHARVLDTLNWQAGGPGRHRLNRQGRGRRIVIEVTTDMHPGLFVIQRLVTREIDPRRRTRQHQDQAVLAPGRFDRLIAKLALVKTVSGILGSQMGVTLEPHLIQHGVLARIDQPPAGRLKMAHRTKGIAPERHTGFLERLQPGVRGLRQRRCGDGDKGSSEGESGCAHVGFISQGSDERACRNPTGRSVAGSRDAGGSAVRQTHAGRAAPHRPCRHR